MIKSQKSKQKALINDLNDIKLQTENENYLINVHSYLYIQNIMYC